MAMYCINMLTIALELAPDNPAYEDIASKFFEHFLRITSAMNGVGKDRIALWNEEDQFYYDALLFPNGDHAAMKVRSIVGIIPLCAVGTLEPETLEKLPGFQQRTEWFIQNRPDLPHGIACMQRMGQSGRTSQLDSISRILSRRQWRRSRGESSNGMDRGDRCPDSQVWSCQMSSLTHVFYRFKNTISLHYNSIFRGEDRSEVRGDTVCKKSVCKKSPTHEHGRSLFKQA
jgi:hypothetical protein